MRALSRVCSCVLLRYFSKGTNLYEVLLHNFPIFAIIIFGYLCGRFKVMGIRSASIFSDFVFFVAIPSMLLSQFSRQPLGKIFNGPFVLAFVLSSLIIAFLTFIFSKRTFPDNLSERAISLIGVAQINTTYLAIPLFLLFLKNVSPIILVMVFQTTILTPISIAVLEYDIYKKSRISKENKMARFLFLKQLPLVLLRAPVISAAIIGAMLAYYNMKFPSPIQKVFDMVGSTAAPLSLFVLGLSLARDKVILKKDALFVDLVGLTLLKNFLHPIIAYFIGKHLFHLDPFWLISLCLVSAMPAARNAALFAQRYGLNVQRANSLILLTTFISFITIGIIITLFKDRFSIFVGYS